MWQHWIINVMLCLHALDIYWPFFFWAFSCLFCFCYEIAPNNVNFWVRHLGIHFLFWNLITPLWYWKVVTPCKVVVRNVIPGKSWLDKKPKLRSLIFCFRSSDDDYCPAEDVEFIQEAVLKVLRQVLAPVKLTLAYKEREDD